VIPNPWVLLGFLGALIGAVLGGYLYGTHHEALTWKAAIAKQEAQAQALLTQKTTEAAAKDAANAELARNLDEAHAKALADFDAARDDFNKRLRLAAGRACGRSAVPFAPGNPGNPADPAAGSQPGLPAVDVGRFERIVDSANKLAEYAKTCHEWSGRVGR